MRIALSISLLFISSFGFAQIGGRSTYQFLNLVNSPRAAATGGYAVPVRDQDESQVYLNPSLLSNQMNNRLVLNYVNYISDINYGYTGFVKDFSKLGTFVLGVNYFNYGKFTEADETGKMLGQFSASDMAFSLGWGYSVLKKLSVGANFKFVYSQLFQYKSAGIAFDLATTYYNPDKNFGASLIVRNIGTQLTTYVGSNKESLPFDVQLSLAKRLKHAPFRFILVGHNLETTNIWFQNLEDKTKKSNLFSKDTMETRNHWGGQVLRHLTAGIEFLPTENFTIRAGYNYQKQQEMKLGGDNRLGMVGFSLGMQIKIKMLTFQYGWSSFHLGASAHYISISARISGYKKEIKEEEKKEEEIQKQDTLPEK